MEIDVTAGTYVVAVSGGVDSVALLHMLAQKEQSDRRIVRPSDRLTPTGTSRLIVAHFDHGIRTDSAEDRRLVEGLAGRYGLPFVYHNGRLGSTASEATARKARYAFLQTVRQASGAQAIVTAHHQDDLLETAVMNMLRGTGRRGLSALKSTADIRRPLLDTTKQQLIAYAREHDLQWREDSTNSDETYLRNYIRRRLLPRLSKDDRCKLLGIVERAADLNDAIAAELSSYLHVQPAQTALDRQSFIQLPHNMAREVMAEWLLGRTAVELSSKLLERLVVGAKVSKAGKRLNVGKAHWLLIGRDKLALVLRER